MPVKVDTSVKLIVTPELKNTHGTVYLKSLNTSHQSSCELLQHIKSILELYPDDQTNLSQRCILPEFILNNSKIIDRSDHWSWLLFKEALAIRRFKPELNHGTKASKDLIIFN